MADIVSKFSELARALFKQTDRATSRADHTIAPRMELALATLLAPEAHTGEKTISAESLDHRDAKIAAIREVADFLRTMNIATISRFLELSDTSIIALEKLHHDTITAADNVFDAMSDEAEEFLSSAPITAAAAASLVEERITQKKFGAVSVKFVRHFLPTMREFARMRDLIFANAGGALFTAADAPRAPINLSNSDLVVASSAVSREELFEIMNRAVPYDRAIGVQANLENMAAAVDKQIVFVRSYDDAQNPANFVKEFDSRGIFDQEFVNKNGLRGERGEGVNARSVRRFNTIKEHALDGIEARDVPAKYVAGTHLREHTEVYVVEAVAPNAWRLLAHPPGDLASAKRITNLTRGQSTRATAYNARAGEAIMARANVPRVVSIVNMYKTQKNDESVAPAMQRDVQMKMNKMRETDLASATALFRICLDAYAANAPQSLYVSRRAVAPRQYTRISNLASKIADFVKKQEKRENLTAAEKEALTVAATDAMFESGLFDVFDEDLVEFYSRVAAANSNRK